MILSSGKQIPSLRARPLLTKVSLRLPIQALELVASLTLSALSQPSNSEVTMIAPASRNETAEEPRIAVGCEPKSLFPPQGVRHRMDLAEAKSVRQPDEGALVTHHRRLLAQGKEMSGPPRRARAQRCLFALRTGPADRHDLDRVRLVVDLRGDVCCSHLVSFSDTRLVRRFVAARRGDHSYLGVTRLRA